MITIKDVARLAEVSISTVEKFIHKDNPPVQQILYGSRFFMIFIAVD
jgi:hypothetical protein